MRLARVVLLLVIGLVLGTALWASMGVLDQLPIDGRMTRVGLLPSWPTWIGLVIGATLVLFAIQHAIADRIAPEAAQRSAFWALPLLALAVLVVPYLPWLADRWPLWQVLAGPFRWLVWAAVGAQLVWVAWQHGWIRAPRAFVPSLTRTTVLVWLAVCLLSGWSAWRLTSTAQFPTGDEPHYLVIAQSLWRDGDLKIENNHARGDYREYFPGDLPPHYLTRGVDGEIYSVHPIGMPVVMAPVYAAAGYPLVVFVFVLMAATAAALIWRANVAWMPDAGAATFGWAAVVTSTPFLLNTLTIYPEIPAALCVAFAFVAGRRASVSPPAGGGRHWRWWTAGVAVAALPWLSTKYAPMSAALVVVLVGRIWVTWSKGPALSPMASAWRASALIVILYVLSLAGWFAFFQAYWGAPWPSGPYGTLTQTTPSHLVFGAPGLLFDQEYGLLPYAPALILAFPGLWRMLRHGGDHRRLAMETLFVFGALLGTVGAFRIWWGGSAVVGRPIVSGLLLLALPIAVQFAATPAGSARRAAQHLLVWVGATITALLVMAQDGVLVGNHRDGTSSLLSWLSPRWELWRGVPTFVQGHTDIAIAWVHSLAWVAIAIVAGWLLARVRPRSAGHAALMALATLGGGLLAGVSAVSWLPEAVAQPRVSLAARTRLAALDGYDRTRRPLAFVYDPFRVASPEGLIRSFVLRVEPGQSTGRQPIRLLHNGRFSLPAGDYRVVVRWARDVEPSEAASLGLQVGRTGAPWRAWTVTPAPASEWDTVFTLPVNSPLVGFTGSSALEERIASIAVQGVAIVNESDRPSTPDVTGAGTSGDVSIFFHDGVTGAEPNGFWALGARRTLVTLATPTPRTGLRLRVHGGEAAHRVTFAVPGWNRTLDLVPGVTEEVDLPPAPRSVQVMTITAEGGFVPSEVNPASDDHRLLGAWIEIDMRR